MTDGVGKIGEGGNLTMKKFNIIQNPDDPYRGRGLKFEDEEQHISE
jgi:hypothetical protein